MNIKADTKFTELKSMHDCTMNSKTNNDLGENIFLFQKYFSSYLYLDIADIRARLTMLNYDMVNGPGRTQPGIAPLLFPSTWYYNRKEQ